jgi:hypothetical protein
MRWGEPAWDGSTPFDLPEEEQGWEAFDTISKALDYGLWTNGWPTRLFEVEPNCALVERGDGYLSLSWHVIRECSEAEINFSIRNGFDIFGNYEREMAESQILWREAIRRPFSDSGRVGDCLREAFKVRGLYGWHLRQFDTIHPSWGWGAFDYSDKSKKIRDAWDVTNVWSDLVNSGIPLDKDLWEFMKEEEAKKLNWTLFHCYNRLWDDRYVSQVDYPYPLQHFTAWAARDALSIEYASMRGWVQCDSQLLTTGIREAYKHGLALAYPTGPNELGYAMLEKQT